MGCSRIYHAENQAVRLDFVVGDLTLIIEEQSDDYYKIRLSHYPDEASLCVVKETQNRYRIINFTKKDNELANLIPIEGLTVPKAAKASILALLEK